MIWDVTVVGAGAAGLMTAIMAKRAGIPSVLLLDSKARIGAKILMSGGTRCNVTNQSITEKDFHTEQKNILKSVLKFFPSEKAVDFFKGLGVEVVLEEGGKYFPETHSGRTILEVLTREVERLGIRLENPRKVTQLRYRDSLFEVAGNDFSYQTRLVVLTTGGLSYPATGSDGGGYEIAKTFGHRIVNTAPSLTPLCSKDRDFQKLSGLSLPARLTLWADGVKSAVYEGDFLFTHFGFSGPVVLNISRHWIREKEKQHEVRLEASFVPTEKEESFRETFLQQVSKNPNKTLKNFLTRYLPQRLAEAFLKKAGLPEDGFFHQVKKEQRQMLRKFLFACPLEIQGTLGYQKAEVTAGGVDLAGVERQTLESKLQPGLFFAGEILDVDGRIGGFNFQWAWSSAAVVAAGLAKKNQPKNHGLPSVPKTSYNQKNETP